MLILNHIRFWLGGLAVLALVVGAGPAAAQQSAETTPIKPPVKEAIGAWSYGCEKPPGAPEELCKISQTILAKDRPGVQIEISILKTVDGSTDLVRVVAPLGILLNKGIGLNIDEEEQGVAPFARCFADGCFANIILDKGLYGKISTAKSAFFTIYLTPEAGIGMPFSLVGVNDGFKKLKITGE